MRDFPFTAQDCISQFASGSISAREIATETMNQISERNLELNAFTEILQDRMFAEADALDVTKSRGQSLPPMAAAPYAVKNMFDVENVTTLAGAKLFSRNSPAQKDSVLVNRLMASGAMLAGTLNMDALAYGFTTENSHYGVTRNPRDPLRTAGGSSGGTGAAIAAGLVPFGLGSDTNGSIRVPSSLCGLFGLKPTYGRLPRTGTFPFVTSLDCVGPLAATSSDLSLVYDVLQGFDVHDPACVQRSVESTFETIGSDIKSLRVARLTGYFDDNAGEEARWAAQVAAKALGANDEVELMGTDRARSAAYVITASEGGTLHLDDLRERAEEFEPLSRERLVAGTLVPAIWYQQAQRFRRVYLQRALELFENYDLLIAPATPVTAPLLGQEHILIGERNLPTRPNLGILTQPISFIGLPVAVAPLWPDGGLPIGVQLIAAPWCEEKCLKASKALEIMSIASSRITGVAQ